MALTGRTVLIAALGALVVAALPGWHGILLVAVVLLLAVLLDLALAAPVRGLRLERDGADSVRTGEEARVRLTLTNPSNRVLRGELRDAWTPGAFSDPDEAYRATRHRLLVPAGERRRMETVLRPSRRGERRPDRVTVRSLGPLGLAARQGSHRVPWALRVLPPFTSRRHLPAKLARLRELDGRTSVLIRGEGTEFDSLREYVPGDEVRSIDWRATARRGSVAVRTWRPERDRHLLLVLDTGRTSAGRVGDIPRLDVSMDAALLLTALASRAGDRVDLIARDRRTRVSVRGHSGREVLPAMVRAMVDLEPALVETDAPGLAAAARAAAPHRSLIVLFTALDPGPADTGLLPILPELLRRHSVMIASVSDPRVAEMARTRGTVPGVYEAAAAARHQEEREEIITRVRRMGATVVEGAPDDLAPAVADAYLALKAAGRL
ncbi:DUF58 domain-containing protein [Streptomyces alkaliphilus]|uniref:DUF58 domain-containing protein n=1 Tax=Streptomyces alkaliphilus TaxID=1472722 RepID=A0A7W3Y391_9ACTN|nr:DUF58 domain-containing protein [Streptomyces alkaliphilus]MBB0246145.1 DUF58 domain-containing protein [Streptomyces alkaliphilus]MQS08706.1 DUF58 domain-containing protein [Streptomyces alkaliphilus]